MEQAAVGPVVEVCPSQSYNIMVEGLLSKASEALLLLPLAMLPALIFICRYKGYRFSLPRAASKTCHGNVDIYELPWSGKGGDSDSESSCQVLPRVEQVADCSLSLDFTQGDTGVQGEEMSGEGGAPETEP